ncbi:hypothetical protein HMI55_002453 [Coelomomyces lativittatus]|nr:hypothetical protein HMI55_002453 [Coelomomyces lativittatus]
MIMKSSGWINYELKQQRSKYIQSHPIRLWIGTWNTAGKLPTSSFKNWLPSTFTDIDIFVFGFQEIDMSTDAYLVSDPKLMDNLLQRISEGLNHSYKCIAKSHLIGMFIFVFTQPEFKIHIRNIETGIVGCGIIGVLGNKGAVAVRLRVFDTQLCFINSHLASGHYQVDRRNSDFHEIKKRLLFKSHGNSVGQPYNEQDFLIFWFGDLNYRIPGHCHDVIAILQNEGGLNALLEKEQLTNTLKKGVAFHGYCEALVHFRPTYKYDIGTCKFDTSEKKRTPAWCDRILWLNLIDPSIVQNLSYQSHPDYLDSDHKPVSALFQLQVDIIDLDKQEMLVRQLQRIRDQMENTWVPEISLSQNQLDFGIVKLGKLLSRPIQLTNTGKLPVNWCFASKGDADIISEAWTWPDPISGLILPGESIEVHIYLHVNFESAKALNQLKDLHFSEIYILRLINGRDHFISLDATWTPSCFGQPLDTLCKDKSIPDLLFQLTTSLLHHPHDTHVFLTVPSDSELETALDIIETSKTDNLNEIIPTCLARLLLLFLQSCTIPVIPYSFHSKFLNSQTSEFIELVSELPPVHRSVLLHLLQFATQYTEENSNEQKVISNILGPTIFNEVKASKQKQQLFLSWMQIFIKGM